MAVLPVVQDPPEDDCLGCIKNPLYFLSQPRRAAVAAANFLKPEIFARRRSTTHRSGTAYLDGLRGWAALLVCFVHLAVYTHNDIERCNGTQISEGVYNDTPAKLPFVRLLFSGGHFSVAVFFCISGYVLTQRLISLLHEDRKEDFVRSVHSSIFRRPLRVFLPVIWSTLMFATTWHVTGLATPWPKRAPNIIIEYWWWFLETTQFMFFFRTGFLFTYYNVHTWTIPVELRGSMFVFVWLFALHHIPHRPRILLTAASIFHLVVLSQGAWYGSFFAGMLTAELHLLYAENSPVKVSLPWDGLLRALWRRPVLYGAFMHVMLVAGLFLASQPTADNLNVQDTLGHCRGWVTLSKVIPPAYDEKTHRWFWLFWASWIVMICAREISWLRSFLSSGFSQCMCSGIGFPHSLQCH
jgi:peptidoglycan/LPS O-acetylase OafA/YrhL